MVADVGIIRGSQSWLRLARRAKFFLDAHAYLVGD